MQSRSGSGSWRSGRRLAAAADNVSREPGPLELVLQATRAGRQVYRRRGELVSELAELGMLRVQGWVEVLDERPATRREGVSRAQAKNQAKGGSDGG